MSESYTVHRDTIESFAGSWSSGLATLHLGSGRAVHGDSGPLGRSLINLFDAYGGNHGIDNAAIRGQDIIYVLEPWGSLAGLSAYEDYLSRGNPEIESGESIEISQD